MELSIKELVELVYKRSKFIVLLILLGAGVLFVLNKYIRKPIYTSSVQFFVSPNHITSTANLNDLNYAQKIVATYINLLRTQAFYRQVLEETGFNYSEHQLKSMTDIRSVNNTELFQISVFSHNASDSYELVAAMQYIAPQLITNVMDNAKISVVDPVVYPYQPSGPNIKLNTMIGAMAGFILAIILSLLWELIDVNVKGEEDLTEKYQLPTIGIIPNFYESFSKKSLLLQKLPFKKDRKKHDFQSNQIIGPESNFVIIEAYKALRTNLLYIFRKKTCKKILVNSPIPQDGKSTTCANIGIAIAQTGSSVLLIDCDLRKGRLHKVFNIKSTPGLTERLSGMKIDNEVIHNTSHENLRLIPIGSIAPNPTELLSSIQLEELIINLEKNYDYIILDSAPVNLVSDALSLAKLVDGILMVVREGCTTYPNIDAAINKYELIDGKIVGFVLNGTSPKQGAKSISKYYYYHDKDD